MPPPLRPALPLWTRRARLFCRALLCYATFLLGECSSVLAEDSSGSERLRFFQAPHPLNPAAKVEEWPRFLGPHDNATSEETHLLGELLKNGPPTVWQVEKGASFAGPAIAEGRVVLFHRVEGKETIECLQAESGKRLWMYDYPAPYQDRYGSGDGPRSSPVIDQGKVFAYGITGLLHCLELATGKLVWMRDVAKEFKLASAFFGCGSTPLAMEGRLVLNIGSQDGTCAIALDCLTGKTVWQAKHPWGASYASPVAAMLHGEACILIFAGGESRPPTGGLLCIDAKTGAVRSSTPHRADIAESVNASSPVVVGDQVFVSESYGPGGEMVEILPGLKARSLWKAENFGTYFMTPVTRDGYLYGCAGQSPRLAELVCYEAASGKEMWRDDLGGKWGRCSLLAAEGRFLCLGEFGDLSWLELTPKGAKVLSHAKLFHAPDSWTLPALSHGLLYVCQNQRGAGGEKSRLICYDLRQAP